MGQQPEFDLNKKEKWGSKFGVVLAVAGSAVGLGNFLRFPGQAVNNGGGAFMIPYIISFLVLGIPIAWCEWTMGRMGGRYGQNSAPGAMYAMWRRAPAKAVGAMTLLIPVVIYMYYVLLEAWCLDYCIEFTRGGFAELFASATTNAVGHAAEVGAVVTASEGHFHETVGFNQHGALFEGSRMLWLVVLCFVFNFFIIYQGVTRGIELFCKWAMPALVICALIILVRVLTLTDISVGLGFMWNPQWEKLLDAKVWLAAAGQIFFSLSVGFGVILCYSSYLHSNDDVVLTSLSASGANEFCEVILGGLIVVPTAFLFLGAQSATAGTFGLGFVTIPAIMNFMPGGHFFGAMWFGLLFLAAITSSLSMLQPAIAFLKDGFGLKRRASVTVLGMITAVGALPAIYYSKGLLALDHTDFWCNLMMIVAATFQVILFGWIIGAEKGVAEMNRGADIRVPKAFAFMIRYVTPTFLILILGAWSYNNLPGYLRQMDPGGQGERAARAIYVGTIQTYFSDADLGAEALGAESMADRVAELLGEDGNTIDASTLPAWLSAVNAEADEARDVAAADAKIARSVFIGIALFLVFLIALSDIACRGRIGRMIRQAEESGVAWEVPS